MTAPSFSSPDASAPRDDLAIAARWGRIALTLLLIPLAWHAFHDQYGTVPLVSDIDLAIHEFGHMLFMPSGIPVLGGTMVILGGSLAQVLFPAIFVAYFLSARGGRRRDVHAAMVCLWWTSINLLSVAIYAADARTGALTLINGLTGAESDGHDWRNLFARWGMLKQDTVIAGRMRETAVLLCVVSIAVGLVAAWRWSRPAVEARQGRAGALD